MSEFEEIDLCKVKTYAIANRLSKVNTANFARPYQQGTSLKKFISQLPNILVSADFKQLIEAIVQAFHSDKQIIVMMGAHVIKCGLSPLIIQLMEAGIIKSLTLNGAGIIHDTEIANWGNTSEDVAEALNDGSFGMVAETPEFINDALKTGQQLKLGLGEAIGLKIEQSNCPNKQFSLLWTGYRLKIPITVHIAIGTDILHQHPSSDGAMIGELTHRDFKIFCAQVTRLSKECVVLNFGSAVILPEVFLKALSVARNLGYDAHGFTTANFDMLQQYRPKMNIVQRPTLTGGKGYQFTGHHEIMIPLLVGGILEGIGRIG
jgi:hypothetical protein